MGPLPHPICHYASIMGILGEHLALGLYLGSEGLDGFWCMHRREDRDNPGFLLEVPQLQASFEDRNTLHAKDREVIKTLGFKFRGRQAWPMFRSYVPGYLPWFVTEEEARFLTAVLEQGLHVIQRLDEDPALLDPPEQGPYLVRTRTTQGWTEEWLIPTPIPVRPPPMVDTKRLESMRQEFPRQRLDLQADLFAMPSPIKDKDDPRPYLPYTLMVVEATSGMILGNDLMAPKPSLAAVWAQTPTQLLDTITRLGCLPYRITVRNQQLWDLLVPVVAGLGIQLNVSSYLPALDNARATLEAFLM